MACIPMFAIAMDHSRHGNAGFDYTLQVTIIFIGSLVAGSFSGFIAETLGYFGAFIIGAIYVCEEFYLLLLLMKNNRS
jgi:MFS transporter, PAT family, beta-lactamase induction signal transducer AmpG